MYLWMVVGGLVVSLMLKAMPMSMSISMRRFTFSNPVFSPCSLGFRRSFTTTNVFLNESHTHTHTHAEADANASTDASASVNEPFSVFPDLRQVSVKDLVGSNVFNSKQYFVERSATGNIPVYSEYKKMGNVSYTEIRKIHGNVLQFRKDLQMALPTIPADWFVVKKQSNKLVIKGDHTDVIKKLLETVF